MIRTIITTLGNINERSQPQSMKILVFALRLSFRYKPQSPLEVVYAVRSASIASRYDHGVRFTDLPSRALMIYFETGYGQALHLIIGRPLSRFHIDLMRS
jgi:hypothetical protein